MKESDYLVRFEGVSKEFPVRGALFEHKRLRAVRELDFGMREGEVLALVGESGCGKTTVARMLARLFPPSSGRIVVRGREVGGRLSAEEARAYRSQVQMIFQDPFGSLNPAHKLGDIVSRPLQMYTPGLAGDSLRARTAELFETVGLTPAETFMEKHPGQISGGQRQRIVIARALAVGPSILLADEPTSMLDVSIGIEIMNLLLELKNEKRLTYLYITHNLAAARYMADRVMVMYAGGLVEEGPAEGLIAGPLHPYTLLLLSSTPEPFRRERFAIRARETLPDLSDASPRCLFHERCPYASERCAKQSPPVVEGGGRRVACFLYRSPEELSKTKVSLEAFTRAAEEES